MNEFVAVAAVRETFEETGIQVEVTGLLGVYSDPGHIIRFTSNDEVRWVAARGPGRRHDGQGHAEAGR